MNMSLTDPNTINGLLGFSSDEEREEFAAERLQLDILHNVLAHMQQLGLTKSDLASRLNVSKSYISQLFACDTPLNLRTLAKIERVLGGRFHVAINTPAQNYESVVQM